MAPLRYGRPGSHAVGVQKDGRATVRDAGQQDLHHKRGDMQQCALSYGATPVSRTLLALLIPSASSFAMLESRTFRPAGSSGLRDSICGRIF